MLIEFTVGNFRSIKDPVTLSMVAAKLVSKDKSLDEQNVTRIDNDLTLLKSAAIYGANASGKTNLARALRFMRSFVLDSSRATQMEDLILVERFRLSTATDDKPSSFEIVFLLDGKKYRYGFEVTQRMVTAEWLFFVPGIREAMLFERESGKIKVSERFKEGKGIEARTRANALFLSVVAQFNGDISGRIISWFRQFRINLGIDDDSERSSTQRFHELEDKEAVLRLIKDLDLGIDNVYSEDDELEWTGESEQLAAFRELLRVTGNQLPNKILEIRTVHRKYDSKGNAVEPEVFDLTLQESAGTQRLFSLAVPILGTLEGGHILFIDELDARLHPLITGAIIGLFNSKRSNPNNAQLIFTAHDTSLLSKKRFRRDQLWFVEKDRFGATHLYSLAEFKVRYDASFEEDYIRGRYGAIPIVASDLRWLVSSENGKE